MSDTFHLVVYNAHMSLVSVSWALFRYPGLWERLDFDCILVKGDQSFKFIGRFKYPGIEDLPKRLFS